MKLKDQVAIVTGAGRGIGRSIAQCLAEEGARVVLVARTAQEVDSAAADIRGAHGDAQALVGDIGRAEDVSRIVDETLRTYGRVDVLVNNAAIGIFKLVVDTTVDEFDAMWTTNMRGLFLMTKAVLPTMMKQASGAIVNISSLAGKNGVKGGAVYAATKWAVRGFAKSLMLEIRDRKIRVVTIFPGSVDTSFSSSNRRRPSITQPDDVAEAVVFAITTPIRTMVSEVDLRPTIPP